MFATQQHGAAERAHVTLTEVGRSRTATECDNKSAGSRASRKPTPPTGGNGSFGDVLRVTASRSPKC